MGWLSGYQYRKKVTISGSSGAGENYQVRLSIGSSSGGDFHLEGHCEDFPNDIRFTDDDGTTLLDYWIEDPSQDPITVWVEVRDNLDNDVDIYCYYGKSGESSASDGEATFKFFDDFPGTSLDTDKWNLICGSVSVGNSKLTISQSAYYTPSLRAKINGVGPGYCLEWYLKWLSTSRSGQFGFHDISSCENFKQGNFIGVQGWQGTLYKECYGYGGDESSTGSTYDTSYHRWKFFRLSSSTSMYKDDTQYATCSGSENNATLYPAIQAYKHSGDIFEVDWVLVRKYVSPEPSFSGAGSEEKSLLTCTDILASSDASFRSGPIIRSCTDILDSISSSSCFLKAPWLPGFTYRRRLTISGSSGAGTGYQIKLKIGSSSGGDFHLNGHCDNFPDDIRFTKEDGISPLKYWIEDPSQDPITVWIKIEDNLDNNVNIYVYYGSSLATSASDGEATFLFFDDFDGILEDEGKAIATNISRNEDAYLYKDFGADHFNDFEILFTAKWTAASTYGIVCLVGLSNQIDDAYHWDDTGCYVMFHHNSGTDYRLRLQRGGNVAYDYYACSMNTVYYLKLKREANSDTINLYIYSDPERTNLLDTLTVSGYGENTKYRYLYAMSSFNSGADETASGYVCDVNIQEGGGTEDLTTYTELDPNSHITSGGKHIDETKWDTSYVNISFPSPSVIKLESAQIDHHGSIYGKEMFTSAVFMWKIVSPSEGSVNTGGIDKNVDDESNRDIYYWQTHHDEYSWARIRNDDDDVCDSPQEAPNRLGIVEVYFNTTFGKVKKDGVTKVSCNASTAGLKPWAASPTDGVQGGGVACLDWCCVRKYADPEPSFSSAQAEEGPVFTCGDTLANLSKNWWAIYGSSSDVLKSSSASSVCKEVFLACLETLSCSDVPLSILSLISRSQDLLGLTDSNVTLVTLLLNAIDSIDVSDGCTLSFSFTSSCLDVLHAIDSASYPLPNVVSCLDSLGTQDSISSFLSMLCQSKDNIGGADGETSQLSVERALLDILAFQDTSSYLAGIIASASDILNTQDLNSVRLTFSCSSIDIVKSVDSGGVNVTFHLDGSDILKGADFVSGNLQILLDSLAVFKSTDQSASSLLGFILRSATDVLDMYDLNTATLQISSSSIDVFRTEDDSSINITLHLNSADIFKNSDSAILSLQALLSVLETLKVSDSSIASVFAEILASASDLLATSDYNTVRLEFLGSAIDIVESMDDVASNVTIHLNSSDLLDGTDRVTAKLEALLSAISKFKSSDESQTYEVIYGVPVKIFKAQHKVLVFRAE